MIYSTVSESQELLDPVKESQSNNSQDDYNKSVREAIAALDIMPEITYSFNLCQYLINYKIFIGLIHTSVAKTLITGSSKFSYFYFIV